MFVKTSVWARREDEEALKTLLEETRSNGGTISFSLSFSEGNWLKILALLEQIVKFNLPGSTDLLSAKGG